MKFYEALKLTLDDKKRVRRKDWPEHDFILPHDQGDDELPNKDMIIRYITNKTRSYAWTPDQLDLFLENWEEYTG